MTREGRRMCGFCGLHMHGTERGLVRCGRRMMRLAVRLGVAWDETKVADDEILSYPYRRGAVQAEA